MACTYKIVNLANGKRYYGGAVNLSRRWTQHRWKLNSKRHENLHLQRAWNKYGESNFIPILLKECARSTLLNEEQRLLDLHVGKKYCYNIAKNAQYPGLGRKVSIVTRRKISEANRGRKRSLELVKRHAEIIRGRKQSIEEKMKRSLVMRPTGYPLLKSPDGKQYEITSLSDFCKEHKLQRTCVYRLFDGKQKQHKGWRIK